MSRDWMPISLDPRARIDALCVCGGRGFWLVPMTSNHEHWDGKAIGRGSCLDAEWLGPSGEDGRERPRSAVASRNAMASANAAAAMACE